MRKPVIAALSLAAATALLLTGCGTTESTGESSDSGKSLSVVDSRGTTIKLDGPATKVVSLEWNATESLVSLGVMPVGAADVKNYALYVTAAPLDSDVTDVGGRGEPSVDAIAGLAPDLVVATDDLSKSAIKQIEKIAPVLVLRPADAKDALGQMEKNLNLLADATGAESKAKSLISDLDAKMADGKEELAAAGLGGTKFALSDAYTDSGAVTIRPYTKGSLLGDVTTKLGLVDAWSVKSDANYGLGSTDVEGLTTLPADVNFLYLGQAGPDPFTTDLAANPIWTSLPFVKAGKVYRMPEGIWGFGGPASMEKYIDAVVSNLAS